MIILKIISIPKQLLRFNFHRCAGAGHGLLFFPRAFFGLSSISLIGGGGGVSAIGGGNDSESDDSDGDSYLGDGEKGGGE